MFSSPDFLARRSRRPARASLLASLALALLASGCASHSSPHVSTVVTEPVAPTIVPTPLPCPPTPPAEPVAALATDAIIHMLAYADRTRHMQAAELGQEVIRLGDSAGPTEQVQLALALSQLHQLPELMRAQELLARVLANRSSEAQTLQPLASLLAARFGEQRRLEDQLEKQAQQTRDVQRRLDQTNDRLEALKAIERSLTNRPTPPASSQPANGRGNRPPAP